MNDPHRRPDDLVPVPCPACGQAQNSLPGDFSLDAASFGPVICVVCGHEFSREEYVQGRRQRLAEWPPLRDGAGPH
jgi:hypothetical protein